jgi:hypothetical protein
MGMFDTIIDADIRCPFCNSWDLNIQTKAINNSLDNYFVGKKYPYEVEDHKGVYTISYIGGCNSYLCKIIGNMICYIQTGSRNLNGRFFTGEYQINSSGTEFTIEKCLSIIPEVPDIKFKRLFDLKKMFLQKVRKNKRDYASLSKLQRKLGGCSLDFALLYWI